jgi:hypothetical protein
MLTPGFARRDLERSATAADLARGRELARQVGDLDWDEYSVWGCLPGEGVTSGEPLLHHGERPLAGECPCAAILHPGRPWLVLVTRRPVERSSRRRQS